MSKAADEQKLGRAFSFHQAGNLNQAANLYRELIESDASNFFALHYLGIIEATKGNLEQAKSLMARSISTGIPNIQFVENYAMILFQTGAYKSALGTCKRGLELSPSNASLLYVSAVSLFKLNRLHDSIAQFDQLLSIQPNHVIALNERASVLAEMKNYDAAIASVDKALSLQPQYPEAYLNKANLYILVRRYDESIALFDKALALKPELADAWLGRGNALRELHSYDEAIAAYEKAIALKPAHIAAWLGRGRIFLELGRYDDALGAYKKALEIDDGTAAAWLGLGTLFLQWRRFQEALEAYDKTLSIKPDMAEAYFDRANVLIELKRYKEALDDYDSARALRPDLPLIEGVRLHNKMQLCDWSNFDAESRHLLSSIESGIVNAPWSILAISSSPAQQRRCAEIYMEMIAARSAQPSFSRRKQYNNSRIRVAYLSADFRDHPTSYLLAGLIEKHDRERFEIIAISFGPGAPDGMRERLRLAFDQFIDVQDRSDLDVARLLEKLEVDIAVDLMGYVGMSRPEILGRRPCDIQVNFLGYPCTMAADYIDYLIADQTVIPESHKQYYTEKIVYLPNSYQPNDSNRVIADKMWTREEAQLPDKSFVFCCFNNSYKITPDVFQSWMRILRRVDGSVLWLYEANPYIASNLRKEAEASGVSATRILFAKPVPMSEHLARYRLADLFIDTLPYNAHTTASDALWTGLPLLTQIGETFAGRVAASLLNAMGLPELITLTQQEYEELAIELAASPAKLSDTKNKLLRNRLTKPLFDTQTFARHIETAYIAMVDRNKAGQSPDHIYVRPTMNQVND
jgi:protein O-GlcNAc transferase